MSLTQENGDVTPTNDENSPLDGETESVDAGLPAPSSAPVALADLQNTNTPKAAATAELASTLSPIRHSAQKRSAPESTPGADSALPVAKALRLEEGTPMRGKQAPGDAQTTPTPATPNVSRVPDAVPDIVKSCTERAVIAAAESRGTQTAPAASAASITTVSISNGDDTVVVNSSAAPSPPGAAKSPSRKSKVVAKPTHTVKETTGCESEDTPSKISQTNAAEARSSSVPAEDTALGSSSVESVSEACLAQPDGASPAVAASSPNPSDSETSSEESDCSLTDDSSPGTTSTASETTAEAPELSVADEQPKQKTLPMLLLNRIRERRTTSKPKPALKEGNYSVVEELQIRYTGPSTTGELPETADPMSDDENSEPINVEFEDSVMSTPCIIRTTIDVVE